MNRREALACLSSLPMVAGGMTTTKLTTCLGRHSFDPVTQCCQWCGKTKFSVVTNCTFEAGKVNLSHATIVSQPPKGWRRITLYAQKDGKWVPLPEKGLWFPEKPLHSKAVT